jgi:hypothetical protein
VTPGANHTYTVQAVDAHWNYAQPVTAQVTVAGSGSTAPRQTGVRADGTYWGGGGEQIDVQSGNVNFTLPLFRAQGRGGRGVTFALNYNSQIWTKDNSGIWLHGQDVGYGMGWRLLAGSITPVYSALWTIDHYVFTDSTGAEYRLDRSATDPEDPAYKLWTSSESVFVTYEDRTRRLRFNDGSYWIMNCEAASGETDAGTRYPTIIRDSNGNRLS